MKNILFTGYNLLNIKPLIEDFKSNKNYLVEIDLWKAYNEHDANWSASCLIWADIILCVGGFENALWYSKYKKDDQILILKMDSIISKILYPQYFNIDNIDCIIVESTSIQQESQTVLPFFKDKIKTINNIADCKSYINIINNLLQDS